MAHKIYHSQFLQGLSQVMNKQLSEYQLGLGQCRSVGSYSNVSRIGEGTYGMVYRAIDQITSQPVALKKIIFIMRKLKDLPSLQ